MCVCGVFVCTYVYVCEYVCTCVRVCNVYVMCIHICVYVMYVCVYVNACVCMVSVLKPTCSLLQLDGRGELLLHEELRRCVHLLVQLFVLLSGKQ